MDILGISEVYLGTTFKNGSYICLGFSGSHLKVIRKRNGTEPSGIIKPTNKQIILTNKLS